MEMIDKILEYWQAGGWLLLPIAVVCFGIWLYFLTARFEMMTFLRDSDGLEEEVLGLLGKSGTERTAAACFRRSGILFQLVGDALLQDGNAIGNFESGADRTMLFLRRNLTVLGGLTAAAPLLGLLGTVQGMIGTFTGVAAAGQAADYVAGGISQALITTQVGLVVAIPGVFGIARLQRLLAAVNTRLQSCRSHLSLGLAETSAEGGELSR